MAVEPTPRPTRTEERLQMSLPSDLRNLPAEEVRAGQTLRYGMSDPNLTVVGGGGGGSRRPEAEPVDEQREKTLSILKREQEVIKVGDSRGGLTRVQYQRELKKRGVSVRELRRATAEGRARFRQGDDIFKEARTATDYRNVSKPKVDMTRNNMSYSSPLDIQKSVRAVPLLSFDPLQSAKNLFFSPLTPREKTIIKASEKLSQVKAPESQRVKAQAISEKVNTFMTNLNSKNKGGRNLPGEIRQGFEKGADVLLSGSKVVSDKISPYNPKTPFTRGQVRGALADVLMFGAFQPLMQTATASQQSAYAEVLDPATGQRRFILKKDVLNYLKQRQSSSTQLSFAEKSQRANTLWSNLRNRDPQSLKKLEKILEEAYGKAFVKEWKLQEGLIPTQAQSNVLGIKTTSRTAQTTQTPQLGVQLKGLSAVETFSKQVTRQNNVLGLKTTPRTAQASQTNQQTRQTPFLQVRTTNILDSQTKQDTKQDTSQSFIPFLSLRTNNASGGRVGDGLASTPRPPRPNKTFKPLPIPKQPILFKKLQKKKIPEALQGFLAQVKERGKWRTIGKKALTREQALALGAYVADNTTAVSARAKAINKRPVNSNFKLPMGKFRDFMIRKGKRIPLKNTLIEKKSKRIDTFGEKKGLSVARFLAQRRKKKRSNLFF